MTATGGRRRSEKTKDWGILRENAGLRLPFGGGVDVVVIACLLFGVVFLFGFEDEVSLLFF